MTTVTRARRVSAAARSRSGSPVVVSLVLLLVTGGFLAGQSQYDTYLYDTFLLACFGAVALNLLMGTAGLVSVGTSGFLMVGAFGSALLSRAGFGFPWTIVLSAAAAGVAGLIVGLPAMRLRGLALGLSSIASYYIIFTVADYLQRTTPGVGAAGYLLTSPFTGGDLDQVQQQWTWLLVILLVMLILAVGALSAGRTGRALRLIRDHETIAPTLGVPVLRYKLLTFAGTSAVIGLEGGLLGYFTGQVITDNFTLLLAIQYLTMVLVGGIDSLFGAVLGAAVITCLPIVVGNIAPAVLGASRAATQGGQYSVVVYGVIVLAIITGSPDGITGLARRAAGGLHRWWRTARPAPPPGGSPRASAEV